jgi:hypothetical protein
VLLQFTAHTCADARARQQATAANRVFLCIKIASAKLNRSLAILLSVPSDLANIMSAETSVPSILQAKHPTPNPHPVAKHHDYFSLSIATGTSRGGNTEVRASAVDALAAANTFRECFRIEFNQQIVCSDDAAAGAHEPSVSIRGASLNDIQTALRDVLQRMCASFDAGKQLSLLLYISMQLTSQDDGALDDDLAGAGSSDGLVVTLSIILLPLFANQMFSYVVMAQVLHPSDSVSSGAISDGYLCAWLNALPPCTCIIIAQVITAFSQPSASFCPHMQPRVLSSLLQMRGCSRPLKLTDFVANARFRGIVISACDLPASDFDHLLVLLKNVSAIS